MPPPVPLAVQPSMGTNQWAASRSMGSQSVTAVIGWLPIDLPQLARETCNTITVFWLPAAEIGFTSGPAPRPQTASAPVYQLAAPQPAPPPPPPPDRHRPAAHSLEVVHAALNCANERPRALTSAFAFACRAPPGPVDLHAMQSSATDSRVGRAKVGTAHRASAAKAAASPSAAAISCRGREHAAHTF